MLENESILFTKLSQNITKARKDAIWEKIADELAKVNIFYIYSQGEYYSIKRSVKECKTKLNNLKSETKSTTVKLRRETTKTGGGDNEAEQLTNIEEVIAEVIGEECIGDIEGGMDTLEDTEVAASTSQEA